MAKKCVHKGCGKVYEDESEPCVYHPGPPVFHEGQKGWKCCKPRVLTFDEFLAIPPCTTGTHSDIDDAPAEPPKPSAADVPDASSAPTPSAEPPRLPTNQAQAAPPPSKSPAPQEDEDDDPSLPIPDGAPCKRKACNAKYDASAGRQDDEQCVHHPGAPIFHEGSKGYSCCKRRVLEFDEFMKIEGCATKARHLFVGKKKDEGAEDVVESVRSDFYQTSTTVIASLFLKKIDKATSTVELSASNIKLDLRTTDKKRYTTDMTLFAPIDPAASAFKIMGTKLELELRKADGSSWPVLRADDPRTGEIIQTGRAGRV
ncbi:hypothetical protein MPH_03137 [Macrophomina phaseolina MS6]|uniref:HSP20-like chaperone n=1 Tax=Macrophomina phaseolina (strain MS6) TaxID=1126212 RepID=K2SA26_MACPH|nr:hypothetical protein MPH_03137 [Macrophomina phaseolina MS6]